MSFFKSLFGTDTCGIKDCNITNINQIKDDVFNLFTNIRELNKNNKYIKCLFCNNTNTECAKLKISNRYTFIKYINNLLEVKIYAREERQTGMPTIISSTNTEDKFIFNINLPESIIYTDEYKYKFCTNTNKIVFIHEFGILHPVKLLEIAFNCSEYTMRINCYNKINIKSNNPGNITFVEFIKVNSKNILPEIIAEPPEYLNNQQKQEWTDIYNNFKNQQTTSALCDSAMDICPPKPPYPIGGKKPQTNKMDISIETITEQNEEFNKNPEYKVTQSFLRKSYINNISANTSKLNKIVHKFNHELKEKITATNQHHTGRCWIFAGLNIIRHKLINKYKLDPSFQISQSYLFFFDKLEKCNYALEMLYQVLTDQKSIDYCVLRGTMLSDGGTWQEFTNLVEKYGVIPQEAFPDTNQTEYSTNLNQILKYIIFRVKLNKSMSRSEFNKIKQDTIEKCYRVLSMCIGCPPTKFNFFFKKDKDREYTPMSFYNKYVKPAVNVADYVVICNDPRLDYHKLYNTEYIHNVLSHTDTNLKTKITNLYLNLPIEDLKKSIKQSIDRNTGVWFACDYSHHHQDGSKILDQKSSQLEKIFDIDIKLSKKESILAGITLANHAMTFVGYHNTKTNIYERWKIENSHGTFANNNGFITMTDSWFDDYVICVAVHKNTLSPKNRAFMKSKIHYLPYYDPLGIYASRMGSFEKLINLKCKNTNTKQINP